MENIDNEEKVQGEEVQPEVETKPEKTHEFKLGSVIVVSVGAICLAVIIWFVFTIWTSPNSDITPPPAPAQTPESAYNDTMTGPPRDPEVLGLRIDSIIGSILTSRQINQTLYVNDEDCTGECLNDWTPYMAEGEVETIGDFGATERSDSGELQYTWKGQGLYTYQLDDSSSVLGDGHSGTWHIARP